MHQQRQQPNVTVQGALFAAIKVSLHSCWWLLLLLGYMNVTVQGALVAAVKVRLHSCWWLLLLLAYMYVTAPGALVAAVRAACSLLVAAAAAGLHHHSSCRTCSAIGIVVRVNTHSRG